jgi:hypothetical protein
LTVVNSSWKTHCENMVRLFFLFLPLLC